MTAFLMITMFVLAIFLFGSLFIQLLPFILIISLLRLVFHRPSVKVYSRSFTIQPDEHPFDSFTSGLPRIDSSANSSADVIDAEYTEKDIPV